MKKLTIIASLITSFASVGLTQAGNSGIITFNGKLTANTCDISIDGQAADATVTLPTVSINQLDATSRTAGDTSFVMALTDCSGPTLNAASAFFLAGASVDVRTGRLKNMSGDATNVSLELLDGSNTDSASVIMIGSQEQASKTIYQSISGGKANLPYIVRYYAEDATTAGTVSSNVVYSIQYQ